METREPGWYWVRLINGDEYGVPGPWEPHHVLAVLPGAVQRISVLHEWGPRIPTPDEPTPPPLPELPSGWTVGESTSTRIIATFYGPKCGVWVMDDDRLGCWGDVNATELHAVLSHHLGLTAPAADVRAAALEAVAAYAAYDAWDGREKQDGLRRDLAVAMDALEDALTGKGAP